MTDHGSTDHGGAGAPTDASVEARRALRVRVQGPDAAPEADEVLLTPARGHIRRRASTAQVRRLVRRQLRLAAALGVGLFLLLVGLYLVLSTTERLAAVSLLGVPLPWLVPGLCIYPLLMLGGWMYVRGAEAAERRLLSEIGLEEDLQEPAGSDGPGLPEQTAARGGRSGEPGER